MALAASGSQMSMNTTRSPCGWRFAASLREQTSAPHLLAKGLDRHDLDAVVGRSGIGLTANEQPPAGVPCFIQEWGKHSWDVAHASPIEPDDARRATVQALAELDASFFRVRFDRLTPTQRQYLRAMAELGPGPHRSGDIARVLQRKVTSVAPTRNALIGKGMIYSPAHGDTAFTVPLFDEFLKRIIRM